MPRVVVVIPVGPGRPEEFAADTAASLTAYLPDARYIALDDSGTRLASRLSLPNLTVLGNPGRVGRGGRLFARLSVAYREALQEPFDLLLRIDDDAVVLGGTFVERALEHFDANPHVGLLGLHHEQYLGDHRTFGWPAGHLRRLLIGDLARADPRRTLRLWQLFHRAHRNGYWRGEHVLSAVSLWRPATLRAIADAGILGDRRLIRSGFSEDHLLGLAVRSVGYAMQGFGTCSDDDPLAVAWKGLPASPDELIAAGKELVHSTKSWAGRDEAVVRATFAAARRRCGPPHPRVSGGAQTGPGAEVPGFS